MTDIATWLAVAGNEKARSIARLAPATVETVVEIGCGTGAVLEALDRRGFAKQYWACEPDSELFGQIQADKISRLAGRSQTTFDEAFVGQEFDLAILTHVVEHLLTPADLVSQALRRARHVIVEVPLDNNWAGRVRATVRGLLGQDRRDNAAGHVQFLSRRSALDLISFSGGSVLDSHGYFPRDAFAALPRSTLRTAVLGMAQVEPLGRVYCEHYAMLAERTTLGTWNHHYHRPI